MSDYNYKIVRTNEKSIRSVVEISVLYINSEYNSAENAEVKKLLSSARNYLQHYDTDGNNDNIYLDGKRPNPEVFQSLDDVAVDLSLIRQNDNLPSNKNLRSIEKLINDCLRAYNKSITRPISN